MNKKISRLLSVLLCVTLLASCTSKPAETPESSSQSESSTASSQSSEAEKPQEAAKISEKERKVTVLLSDNTTQPTSNYALAQQATFEKTNIKLEFQIVPSSNYKDKKAALMATNQMPEISFVDSADLKEYGPVGLFMPLNEHIDSLPHYKAFLEQYPDMRKSEVDGVLYGFQMVARNETANGPGPVIRTDLLKKHNIPVPTTFEELLDVLEKLKAEYPDSKPYSNRNGAKLQHFKTTAYALGSGYSDSGPYYDYDVDGGSFVYGPATPEFKEVLKYFADAYKRGIIDADFLNSTAEQFQSNLISGKAFFFYDNSGFSLDYTRLLVEGEPEGTLDAIPYLTNSQGQRRNNAFATSITNRYYALRADVKDPEVLLNFMDWMYSPEGSDITNYGKEGVSFEYNADGKPEFKQDYINKFLDKSPVHYAVFSDAGITKLNFTVHGGNTEQMFEIQKIAGIWDERSDEYWSLMAKENDPATGAFKQPVVNPPLSKEQAERATDIVMNLNTYLEQEYNKYIMGVEPIENWDKVIAHAEELGARELEDIYNAANAAYK